MFFGGNKNISKKLGAFILAFVFVFGLFVFNNVNAQDANLAAAKAEIEACSKNGKYDSSKFGIGTCSLDEDSYEKLTQEYEQRNILQGNQKIISDSELLIESYNAQIKNYNKQIGDCLNGIRCPIPIETLEDVIDKLEDKKEDAQKKIDKAQKKVSSTQSKIKDINNCGSLLFDTSCHAKKIFNTWLATISNAILEFVGLILRAAGLALDTTIDFTILGMSTFLKGDQGKTIQMSWSIFRDIINILFIFGLLYISISTIIKGLGAKTKTALVSIIASALLINFSYFFTAVLIDGSNFLSTEIYNSIETIENCNTPLSKGISGCLISKVKLTTVFNPEASGGSLAKDVNGSGIASSVRNTIGGDSGFAGSAETYIKTFIATIMGSIFIVITAFVLLSLAIMLLIRFIMLIMLLITSPVMFLGWVLPNFSGISKKWFNSLNDQLLFPPLVFLFIFITLSIADGINMISSTVFGTVINYLLIIGFMVSSIMIAKKVGATGANFATKYAGIATTGLATRATTRGVSSFGRNTIGRGSAAIADKIGGTGAVSNFTRERLKNISTKSFDARNTKAFQGVASKTGLTGVGSGSSLGYREFEAEKAKRKAERYDEFGKQTQDESRRIEGLTQKINNNENTKGDLNKKKGLEKDIQIDKEEIKDLNSQMQSLDKNSSEYKNIQSKAKDVAGRISNTKDEIGKIEEGIRERHSEEIGKIEEIKEIGKERQKEYVGKLEKSKLGGAVPERLRKIYRGATDSNNNEALRIIGDKIRNKDGEDGVITKIIKEAKDVREREERIKKIKSNSKNDDAQDFYDNGGTSGI